MSSAEAGYITNMIDRYVSCGCSRKMKNDPMEDFEIVNLEDIYVTDVTVTPTWESAVSTTDDGLCRRKTSSNLEQYFIRSLTNPASPKSSLNLMHEGNESRGQLASQSGPDLNQASRKSLAGWQKMKAVFKRSTASEGAIITNPKYTTEEQIEAYKNIWKYDSTKSYYYEDLTAAGALLLDLPPQILINMKYRRDPFNKKSAEEVVRAFLAKISLDLDTVSVSSSAEENTQVPVFVEAGDKSVNF